MPTRGARFVLTVLVMGGVASSSLAACSSKGKLPPNVIQAGQLDIQLPPGWKVTASGAVAPAQPGPASNKSAAATSTTIPLNKQNPTTEFFQATATFGSCLKGLGVTFIGPPDFKNPHSPTNNPNYLKSLTTCAAQSHILQAIKDFQAAENNLTPKQIQQANQAYLRWRTCMIGRGWKVPDPVPDSKGRLFSINSDGSGGPQLAPPPGENALSSPDIQHCLGQAQLPGLSGSP